MMKLLIDYLKTRLGVAALTALLCGLFFTVGSLSGMSVENVGYGLLLALAALLIVALWDFRRFYIRHEKLRVAGEQILISAENLPLPGDIIEADYQQLIALLREDALKSRNCDEQRYSEMLDYFTMWAHQIKTPIAAMRLVLQSSPEPGSDELEQELFRIEQYVETVLSYIRLDSDYTDYVLRRCELDGIIKQSLRKYAGQFIRKRISLVYEGTQERVLTDEKWLCFVIDQLLANALKYTYSGSIEIKAGPDRLSVSDSGIGIAPEDLPRVFEKGYTGYNGRTDKKSTGIGLYLCRRILDKLGHQISIESIVGQGTTVTIEFKDKKAALPE